MLAPEVLFWLCGLQALAADAFILGCHKLRFRVLILPMIIKNGDVFRSTSMSSQEKKTD